MNGALRLRGAAWFTGVTAAIYLIGSGFNLYSEKIIDRVFAKNDTVFLMLFPLILFALLGFLLAYGLYPRVNRMLGANARVQIGDQLDPKRFLVTGYSPYRNFDRKQLTAPVVEEYQAIADAQAACGKENTKVLGNWQQNVRVIYALEKAGQLGGIYVINPSPEQFDAFHDMIKHFFPNLGINLVTMPRTNAAFSVTHGPGGTAEPDYEDFRYVFEAVVRALDMIGRETGMTTRDIEKVVAIDITPGFKIFSVAAAMASLNSGITAVYASTFGGRETQVKSYDASITLFQHG